LAPADAGWLVLAGTDPDIVKWNGVSPTFTADAAGELIALRQRQWGEDRRATFAIANEDDQPGGYLSVRFTWHQGIAEVGYWLLPTHRGRGLMTDSVRSMRDWVFDTLAIARLQIAVQPGNPASESVPLRLGFTREGLLRSWDILNAERIDEWMFSLLPEDARL
jgi:RimJ/RimL family protein N-acetyltransferase